MSTVKKSGMAAAAAVSIMAVVGVVLLWGKSDRMLDIGYARRMAEQLPAARLTLIPHCGHAPQQECPQRFAAALLKVLQQDPPEAAR